MISVVIPVLDEALSLPQLHRELTQVAAQHGYDFEILFVDDGSRDPSWSVIADLAAQDPRVRGIRFRRNFGKAAALAAGFRASQGEILFTLDADLQDDPREMPKFLRRLDEALDVVSGWKQQRFDPWHKVWPSRVFNRMVSRTTGVSLHDHNCGYKCFRREAIERLSLYGELHRFIPVLVASRGWRVGEVVVEHRRRMHGRSKFGIWRIPKGFLDLLTVKFLTDYGRRPQHFLGAIGLTSLLASLAVLAVLVARMNLIQLWTGTNVGPLTDSSVFFLALVGLILGGQFLAAGFLAELMTAQREQDRLPYNVSETVGLADGESGLRTSPSTPLPARREDPISGPHWGSERASGAIRENP